jgi:hypothetical protein
MSKPFHDEIHADKEPKCALEITTWPSLNATRPGRRRTISWEVLVAWLGLPWPEFAGDFQQRGWSPGTFTAHHRAGAQGVLAALAGRRGAA